MLPNIQSYYYRTKLFVGRLPEGCTSRDLDNLFRKFGNVIECDVIGKFGFVHMDTRQEAEECVKRLNKYTFMGSQLSVEFSTSKIHPQPGTTGRAKGSLCPSKKMERNRNKITYSSSLIRHRPHVSSRDGYSYRSYYANDFKQNKDSHHNRDLYYNQERLKTHHSLYDSTSHSIFEDSHNRKSYFSNSRFTPYNSSSSINNIYARRQLLSKPYNRRDDVSTPMYSTQSPQHSCHRLSTNRCSNYWNSFHSGLNNDYLNQRRHRYDNGRQ